MYRALRTVIDNLDQRRAQVYVEALIVEVSTGHAAEFGVQWQGATRHAATASRSSAAPTSTPASPAAWAPTSSAPRTNFPGSLGQGLNLGIIDGTLRDPRHQHRDR